jgi:hypothetical protein
MKLSLYKNPTILEKDHTAFKIIFLISCFTIFGNFLPFFHPWIRIHILNEDPDIGEKFNMDGSIIVVQENQNTREDNEEDSEEDGEGFLLDRNVVDAFLPDLTLAFSSLLGKVRAVVKFFRDTYSE